MGVSRQKGFVLIAMSVTMLLLIATIGMAFDFGRIYICRNEAQIYTDAAALTAVVHLDGSLEKLNEARDAVKRLPGHWNLGTEPFKDVIVEFSADGQHWTPTPEKDHNTGPWTRARVTAPANELGIVFLRAIGGPESLRILSRSTAQANPARLIE
jgi:Putative Flp pilus-assembly TadE/G-like